MQRYLLGDIGEATRAAGRGDRALRGGRRGARRAQRAPLARSLPLAARRQAGVAAPDRSRDRRPRAPRTEPGAGDGVQLPLAERHARAGLRGRREVGSQGDRDRRADRCHRRPRACLQQPRGVPDLAGRPRGRRLPAPEPRPGDREPPPQRRRSRLRQPQRAGPSHLPVRRTRSRRRCWSRGSSTPPGRSPTGSSTDGSAPDGANSSSSPADGRRRSP